MMNIEEIKSFLATTPSARHWEKIGVKRRAGVIFPLFSLKTETNLGIGEFADLKLLVDWCVMIGNSIIQLLPLNDSGPDNTPYSALSAFALNPIYLSCSAMDGYREGGDIEQSIEAVRLVGQAGERFNYDYLYDEKMKLFHRIFVGFVNDKDSALIKEFERYCNDNREWLVDYSLYISLKEAYEWARWEKWPEGYKDREADELNKFREQYKDSITFYSYLQWQAEKQLRLAREYASQKSVLICGDLPFLVARDSADIWCERELFNLDRSAGAPPDDFSADGQKWGFPTINRNNDKKSGYAWHKRRLHQAEKFYDIYRIDHAIGLYRIYSIIVDEPTGREGWFDPPDADIWQENGEEILREMLGATDMLPIAEDLGFIPDCVRPSLRLLGIPRTILDRWERNYHGDASFKAPADMETIASHYLSTHDTEILREWWNNNSEDRRDFYKVIVGEGEPPEELTEGIHWAILKRSYASAALFSINLPQDIFSGVLFEKNLERHRINIPSLISDFNWSYRFPIGLEELLVSKNASLESENKKIRELIEVSGRI